MSKGLDLNEFQSILLSASRSFFTDIQHSHVTENFYAFGLFHEPLWGYILPASNTEEGLKRRAHEYQLDEFNIGYAQMPLDEIALSLRWSTGDWAYLSHDDERFEPVNQWLEHNNVYWAYKGNTDEWEDKLNRPMIEFCRKTLLTLQNEGVFGNAQQRKGIVLNVLMGDQDRSWYEHARILNPPAVYERWVQEVEAGFEVGRRLFHGNS